ncbi:MAG: Pyridinium-3,5-bisthiocarboxylic acid mononucleotide nickel insertion protein [Candidatus Moanabacter tarae]|uniref:Pyridinium-3,5-bisthiocarboxylic acid mononucleotide nickel insertion protein n=1 Tax=Candidatus Moanibacter tarae TaxID=2200854 RepID=A0A2Z4ACD1_9BACT|nr:MAG: Pyridinium-3,5-bisthiocarboxylic acid mononucleotide nickel insertion protein [Candidatus Moanabacter tarae]|tara:strand:+ start:12199 stop:13518 length:1320 start_codon:yes stop_codon:yes gene_type:complete
MNGNSDAVLFIESIAGIAGDMFSAACVDAELVTAGELKDVPDHLGFDGVSVRFTRVKRAHLVATHMEVLCEEGAWTRFVESRAEILEHLECLESEGQSPQHAAKHSNELKLQSNHIPVRVIELILDSSNLCPVAVRAAKDILKELACAEAKAHGTESGLVHFHEIGRIDSIVDIAMAGLIISRLSPKRVFASGIKLGRGNVRIAHGLYPVPPPASAILSQGFPVDPVPDSISRRNLELSTPTGLAILRVLQPSFTQGWPSGRVITHGCGAGSMELKNYPNVTRVVWMEDLDAQPHLESSFVHSEIIEIVCNLDDETPERTAWLQQQALKRGALDVWITPIVGKKNRAAQLFSILTDAQSKSELVSLMLRSSATFGLRTRRWDKVQLVRRIETRDTIHGPLRFKIGITMEGDEIKEKPEYDDLEKIWEKDPNFRPDSGDE